jgi:hypothetical protein
MTPLSAPSGDDDRSILDDDDDGEGFADEHDTPLVPTGDEPPEFGDELPTDPSFDIDLPSELEGGESEAEAELPVGSDFFPEDEQPTADDSLGFANTSESVELPNETDASLSHDAADGFDDAHSGLDEGALPSLGDDDGPDLDEARFGVALESADEALLPKLEKSFRVAFLAPDREHCNALCASGGVVVAGSNDLFWLDEGRETVVRIGLDGTRIASIALVGELRNTALCVTAFGRLLRRARSGGEVERLVDWRRIAEASGASAESLELRGLGPARPNSVLGRLTSGRLVRSDDLGSTFRAVADASALSMSSSGDPVAILMRDGARLGLSSDGGTTWERLELASPAREVASGEAPLVAASGNVVVLGDAERGLVVSADRGRTFRRVSGLTNLTALCVGTLGGEERAFAALYRETDDHSLLVEIDPRTATAAIGAVLSLPSPDDPDATAELGRVERLVCEGERLWATGGFGLAVATRQASQPT